jgi:hypothetical protein
MMMMMMTVKATVDSAIIHVIQLDLNKRNDSKCSQILYTCLYKAVNRSLTVGLTNPYAKH